MPRDTASGVYTGGGAPGALKADIMASPSDYVCPDPETALALLDQKHAGGGSLPHDPTTPGGAPITSGPTG